VSDRIILSPHICSGLNSNPKALLIKMDQGSAFGIGDHPTTRLSLRAVDVVMDDASRNGSFEGFQALDIGTGSGVLAIAAVGLGAARAVGIDIDPVALHEAGKNIQLNGMKHKIILTTDFLESLGDSRFCLVMANVRPPTLKQMLPVIEKVSTSEAYWVFSGFREEALENFVANLPSHGSRILWKEKSCGWAALAAKYERK
jgi:ribosomal protein L11 methyltransferase